MSRTYKTDPFRVKLNKPECSKLKVVEDHDHRFGLECDLPENPLHEGFTRCTWEWEWNGINLCCCHGCSKGAYEKPLNRRERTKAKSYARNFEDEYLEDDWYENERNARKLDVLSDEIMQEFNSDY